MNTTNILSYIHKLGHVSIWIYTMWWYPRTNNKPFLYPFYLTSKDADIVQKALMNLQWQDNFNVVYSYSGSAPILHLNCKCFIEPSTKNCRSITKYSCKSNASSLILISSVNNEWYNALNHPPHHTHTPNTYFNERSRRKSGQQKREDTGEE